jgi:hypothetical protein
MSLAVAFFFSTHKPIQQPLYIKYNVRGGKPGVGICKLWRRNGGMWTTIITRNVQRTSVVVSLPGSRARECASRYKRGWGQLRWWWRRWGAGPRVSIPISRAFFEGISSDVDCLQSFPFWGYLFCRGLSAGLPFLWAWSGCQSCTAVEKKKAPF